MAIAILFHVCGDRMSEYSGNRREKPHGYANYYVHEVVESHEDR